ncbi:pentatricopeptide repeat-containing protein, partial [Tanacetum coccineum]
YDSPMWATLNQGGRTVFLEEDKSWIKQTLGNCNDLDNARKLLDEMSDHLQQGSAEGRDQSLFCQLVVIPLLLTKVIRTMPYDPTPAMWAIVIGGCRILGKNKLRKFAAEKLLEMRPRSSGYYVLVANMYADYNGCWKKLANIRVLRRNWE